MTADAARDAALRALSRRGYSVGELRRKLEAGFDEAETEEALQWLTELRYLNDREYARGLAAHCVSKGYGLRRCERMLRDRLVDAEAIEEALADYPAPEGRVDELLRRYAKSENPEPRERQRLTGLLLRRGFDWDEIRDGLNRLGAEDWD